MKILKLITGLFFATFLAFVGGITVSSILPVNPFIPGTVFFLASMIPTPNGAACFNIFSAPGGVATPFTWQMNYLPQFISFVNTVPLTSLRVETAEDGVLHDWTAAGLVAMANFLQVGAMTANVLQFRLADGELRPKNVTISGVTSAAGVVPFFVSSDNIGKVAFRSKNAAILANNPTTFEKFTALFIPTMATATDRAEITFASGLVQTMNMEDLRNLSGIYQETQTICVNNINSYISKVVVTCAAATPAYILSYNI
jgi:hypothetical protein